MQTTQPSRTAVRSQIRGSSLLLAGRMLSAGTNFGAQVLLVRYLSQTDYGAFAYALAIVNFCQVFSTAGMKTTVARYIPFFHEKRQYESLFGTLALAVVTTSAVGLSLVAVLIWPPDVLARLLGGDQTPLALIAVMALIIPLQGLDALLINLFASFGKSRAIFLRKFLLTPAIKLSVVVVLIVSGKGVVVMAYGYLAGSVVALLFSLWVSAEVLRSEGLLKKFRLDRRNMPTAEVFRFSISVMGTDVVPILIHSVNIFLLGYHFGPAEVAIYTVVLPAARLNKIVVDNVTVLYTPLVVRFFARGDSRGLNDVYWQTTAWITMASFPIFALTFAAAKPVTELLYGAEYSQSSSILMLLAFGYYFNVALGCNGDTLRCLGRIRYLLTIESVTAGVNVVGNIVLIRLYGALGAGICIAGTLVLQSLLRQWGLRSIRGLRAFDPRFLRFYAVIGAATVATAVPNLYSGAHHPLSSIALVILTSVLVFVLGKKKLHIGEVFPELTRIPLVRVLVT